MWLPGGSDRTHSDPGGGRGRSEKRWPGGGEKVGEDADLESTNKMVITSAVLWNH